jgi:tetratricopeptide (TPR) repeat protein
VGKGGALAAALRVAPAWTLALALGSCANLGGTHEESRQQAEQRWDSVRGKIKLQLATESFNQGRLDEAAKQLAEAVALDPTLSECYLLRTRILLEKGEIASAAEALKTAVSNGASGAQTDYLAGVIAQRYGRFEEALNAYRLAADREPRQAHYTAAVAETLVALDRPAEALALIEERWTDFEHNATLRATAGQIHMLMGRYERAADAYREAVRIAPDDVTLQYQLGLALSMSEKYAEAVGVLAPLNVKRQDLPAYVLIALGRSYLGLARELEAVAVLRQATAASPDSPGAWSWLARAALTAGDLVTARQAAARAADLDRDTGDSRILLGYVCLRQGDRGAAIQALQSALARHPEDPLALELLNRARGGSARVRNTSAATMIRGSSPP